MWPYDCIETPRAIMKRGDRVKLADSDLSGAAQWFHSNGTMVVRWDGDDADAVVLVNDVELVK